jgi:hypothetical protein
VSLRDINGVLTFSGKDVDVPYSAAGSATQGSSSDYTLFPAGQVTIPAGFPSMDIRINVRNDDDTAFPATIGEPAETIILTLGTPLNDTAWLGTPASNTTTILPWSCPTASNPSLISAGGQRRNLVWPFSYTDSRTLRLTQVSVSWPTPVQGDVTGITFGTPIGAPSYYPSSSGSLTVSTPSPLWTGSSTQQMVFSFSRNPGPGTTRVTARFDHCPELSGNISQ